MAVRSGDLTEKWQEYVYRDQSETVREFVSAYPEKRALSVSCERVGHDYRFVRSLLAHPDDAFRAGKSALRRFCTENPGALSTENADRELQDVYLRVTDLPAESEVALSDLRAAHLNRLVTTRGEVVDAGTLRPKIVRAAFRCSKCEDVTRYVAQPGREFRTNARCPRCSSVGYLSLAPEASEYVDSREIAVRAPEGDDEVAVLLEHDLTGTVSDGDHVELVAIPRASRTDDSTVTDLWVEAVSLETLTSSSE